MKIRDVVLQNRIAQLVDARTWTFNIDLVDPVTEFKVDLRINNNAVGPNDLGCVPYVVREIAVIDGSEVIASLNGPEAFALSCFDYGFAPMHWHQEAGGMEQHWCMPIHFGRSLNDPEWIFDPTRFRNPQIRIDFDLGLNGGVGANAWATETTEITVWAKVMEQGASPRGYLMNKEVRSYVSTNGGEEITWLPTDFAHRKLMVRCYKRGGDMNAPAVRLKLSQDQDKWIPFDLYGNDFQYLMRDWFTEVDFHLKHCMDHNEHREHYQGSGGGGVAVAGENNMIISLFDWALNWFGATIIDNTAAELTNKQLWTYGKTRNPFDAYCYPFGDQDDPADWLDVSGMGNLRLILQQDPLVGEGYDVEIVCQQAHPY